MAVLTIKIAAKEKYKLNADLRYSYPSGFYSYSHGNPFEVTHRGH